MQSLSAAYASFCLFVSALLVCLFGCSAAPRPRESPDVVLIKPTAAKHPKPAPTPPAPPAVEAIRRASLPRAAADFPAPPAAPPPQPKAPAPAETDPEATWFGNLKQGRLQYSVPSIMQWKVPTTVTVQISGEAAPKAADLENQTGEAAVTVSRRMRVLVSAPDNPDEFLITTEPDTQAEQYVPDDGPTTWNYSVTPRYTTSTAKVVIRAWIVYDANTQRELPVYQKVVMVKVPGLGECLKRLVEGDPDYWLKYGLPGGSGFIFLSGLIAGIWKWRATKRKLKAPAP